MCDSNEIGDEYHTLLNCSTFSEIRDLYVPQSFSKYPSESKFDSLMADDNNIKLTANIATLVRSIFRYRKTTRAPPVNDRNSNVEHFFHQGIS